MAHHNTKNSFAGTDKLGAYLASLDEAEWVRKLRLRALDRFSAMEWPTRDDEEWRRSDISNYDFDSYEYGTNTEGARLAGASGGVLLYSLAEFFSPEFAASAERDAEASKALAAVSALVSRRVEDAEHRLEAWRYVAMTHGAVVYLPGFREIDEPIVVRLFEDGDGRFSAPEVFVVAEPGARGRLVVQVEGADDGEVLLNCGIDVYVGEGASVEVSAVQTLNIDASVFGRATAYVAKDGHARIVTADFGGMFVKRESRVVLEGRGADAFVGGMTFPFEDQHMDVRSVQHHRAADTNSRAFFKAAVRDEGRSVYQGMIEVEHEAERTDAFLENKNLILNEGARADSIPSLMIRTNDVKCSHGSTTGRLDVMQIYYLMTRGLTKAEATALVLEGFFEEVITRTDASLHEPLHELLVARIEAEMDEEEDED